MAEYKDIHGTTIRNSAGNLAGAKTGELFFDSTNLDFKYLAIFLLRGLLLFPDNNFMKKPN